MPLFKSSNYKSSTSYLKKHLSDILKNQELSDDDSFDEDDLDEVLPEDQEKISSDEEQSTKEESDESDDQTEKYSENAELEDDQTLKKIITKINEDHAKKKAEEKEEEIRKKLQNKIDSNKRMKRAASNDGDCTTHLIVRGLPLHITEGQIKNEYPHAACITLARGSVGFKKRFAFMEFHTIEDATEVMNELNTDGFEGYDVNAKYYYPMKKMSRDLKEEQPSNTLFVSNIPTGTTEEMVESWFEGTELIKMPKGPNGDYRGLAFVKFKSEEDAVKAKSVHNERVIQGHMIKVRFSHKKSKSEKEKNEKNAPSNVLKIFNLNAAVTGEDLLGLFHSCQNLQILNNHYLHQRYAKIAYSTVEEAKRAKSGNNGSLLHGTPIKVKYGPMNYRSKEQRILRKSTNKLQVRNLPKTFTKKNLKTFFKGAYLAEIIRDSKNVPTGVGIVTFRTVKEAEENRSLYQKHSIENQRINILFHKDSTTMNEESGEDNKRDLDKYADREPTTKLLLRNLSYTVSDADLQKTFPKAISCSVALGHCDRSKGFAFVEFKSVKQATKAKCKWNKKNIKGRPVAICYAT